MTIVGGSSFPGGNITNTEASEDKPVTAKLVRKIRNNVVAASVIRIRSYGFTALSVNTTAYSNVWTFELFIPSSVKGNTTTTAGKTRLTLSSCRMRTALGDTSLPRISNFRLKIGTYTSDEVTNIGTGATTQDMVIDFTPTYDAFVTILAQGKVDNTAHGAEFVWAEDNLGILELKHDDTT